MERKAYGPAHPVTVFHFAHPDGLAAVAVVDQLVINRILAGSPVMVEYVPFHASAYPGTEHTHIGRLYHVLAVEDFVAVGLVGGIKQPAADIWKDAELEVVVFQIQCLVGGVHLDICRIVVHGIRIDSALRPLVGEIPLEQRRPLRSVNSVGRKVNGPFPNLYRAVFGRNHDSRQCCQADCRNSLLIHCILLCFFHATYRKTGGVSHAVIVLDTSIVVVEPESFAADRRVGPETSSVFQIFYAVCIRAEITGGEEHCLG